MNKLMQYIILFMTGVFYISCAGQEDSSSDQYSSLVIEGWIENNGFPVVIVTQPLPVNSEYHKANDLNDYVVKWAKVTVSCDEDSAVLTGMYDDSFFPAYVYTTSRIRGKVGKKYQLTVEYRDKRVKALTYIPETPVDCTFRVEQCAHSDTLYQIMTHFSNEQTEPCYYQLFSLTGSHNNHYLISYLGSIDGSQYAKVIDYPVYRGQQLTMMEYTPYYLINDSVSVICARVDETSYRIFDSYTKELTLSGNIFLSVFSNLETNIIGGYGYWCGLGSVKKNIIIRNEIE